jgi:two-component system, LuxR family, sensor kinase FixL
VKPEDRDLSGDDVFSFGKDRFVSAFADQYRYSTLGALVKGIIHNLNGTLHVLSVHLELLQKMLQIGKDGPGSPVDKRMDLCLGNVDKLKGIIDLLAQKAIRDEQDAPQLIQINELIEEELSLLAHNLFLKHQVKVRKELSPGLPVVQGLYVEFSQGISNLIQNAIEAMEEAEKRELTISTRGEGDFVRVMIKDTGCGISKEAAGHLFKPFFSTKGKRHNGLGLFISRELLTSYGASMEYVSGEGETTFSVSFPIPRRIPKD